MSLPLAHYRPVFAAPGTLAFTLSGLLGRLAMAMHGVCVVVLVADRRGSYALAGAVSAVGVLAGAVLLPPLGRLVDRWGQARVAVPAVLATAVPTGALLLCVRSGAPAWTLFPCWALAGSGPDLGGMARARWAHLHRADPAVLHRANALEQALDELCFMAGPVLGMVLCTTVAPEAGLLAAWGLGTVGTLLFAAQRATEPPVGPHRPSPARGLPRTPGLPALLAVFLAAGVLFGALEVTTLAYADALGRQAAGGGLLALVAAGSCVSGLAFGAVRPRRPAAVRLALGAGAMAALMLLPLAAGLAGAGLPVLGAALLAAGSGTAPTMVSGMTLAQRLLPAHRLTEGMALVVSAILVGISTGATLGGALAQHTAPGTGYLLPAGAAVLALTAAFSLARKQSWRFFMAGRMRAPAASVHQGSAPGCHRESPRPSRGKRTDGSSVPAVRVLRQLRPVREARRAAAEAPGAVPFVERDRPPVGGQHLQPDGRPGGAVQGGAEQQAADPAAGAAGADVQVLQPDEAAVRHQVGEAQQAAGRAPGAPGVLGQQQDGRVGGRPVVGVQPQCPEQFLFGAFGGQHRGGHQPGVRGAAARDVQRGDGRRVRDAALAQHRRDGRDGRDRRYGRLALGGGHPASLPHLSAAFRDLCPPWS
ncbi:MULTISPECIES: MFS transporter [Kitasatospora]|uniref:Putative drug resistance protein n=1 Tax=Kitasatospora setae (strain ATCC 33774 / DSM 43861 / JCM 3304 / KCC A-0304 / NBRC 14216 / KM-6054) TaxID=452652 RepID=E4NDM5_KITSK|nr:MULTISPECIES: MFS transporter [Kitasatospora]BAJ29306.1 putative drug resistance protein [Kitasatospora setae KM-6054]